MNIDQVVRDPASLHFSADDALRLTEVRDLVAGQSWFDLTQYRMTPPLGVPMHWSRLIDAPIAGLILFFRMFTSHATAEMLATTVWPLLLLLPVLLALGWIAQRLADKLAGFAVLLLAIGCFYACAFFVPGEIDHHNAQMALTVVMAALFLNFKTSVRAAVACAVVLSFSLCIGLETLPYDLTVCLIVAGYWIARGTQDERSVRGFCFALVGVSVILFFTVVADRERWGSACDTFSRLYALLIIAGGLGLAAMTYVPALARRRVSRAIAVGALAVGAAAIVFTLAPQCARGPYAMFGPDLDRILLSRIDEARSPLISAANRPDMFFGVYVYALVGWVMSFAAIFLVKRENMPAAIVMAALTSTAVAVTTYQLRGAPFALLLGAPGIAVTIRELTRRWIRTDTACVIMMIGLLALFTEAAFMSIESLIEDKKHSETRAGQSSQALECIGKQVTSQLARLPKGRVASLIFAAPAVLAYTTDSVMAASYNRDGDAILDAYRMFTNQPNASAAIARRYGVDYIVTCRSDPDYAYFLQQAGGGGLLSRLNSGQLPAWLQALPPSGPRHEVQVYEVMHNRLNRWVVDQSTPKSGAANSCVSYEARSEPELTVLMPCLNEAETIQICIRKSFTGISRCGLPGEVLVADNGSSDASPALAIQEGARVVRVQKKGYGAALLGGISHARGRYVIMGDADDSYDFENLGILVDHLRGGADLVIGNRFKGGIAAGAMPPLHRYLGNPVLSFIGRLFFNIPIGDFHCGLRGFSRDAILALDLRLSGMEFASEMIVKAALAGLRIDEVPTTLKPDGRSRSPHLRSWQDGWRHLRFLLLYSPNWLFIYPGLFLIVCRVDCRCGPCARCNSHCPECIARHSYPGGLLFQHHDWRSIHRFRSTRAAVLHHRRLAAAVRKIPETLSQCSSWN